MIFSFVDQAKLDLIFVNATKTVTKTIKPKNAGSAKKTSVGSNDFIVCCMSVPASVSNCGALAPEWRFGTSLWRQKFSQAPRKKVYYSGFS